MAASASKRVKSVAELQTAADLTAKLDELRANRKKFENDWKLNLAFYRGNQYSYVSKSGRLETLPVEDGEKPRYRVRLVSNQVVTGSQSLLAKLTKTKPIMSATPASSSDNDVKAAQMSEQLLEDWWVTMGLDDKLEEALLWAIIAGQGWWKITWDQHAGMPMNFTMNPMTGQPMTDDSEIQMYKQFLTQNGMEETYSDQTVYLGDIRVDVMSPFQVWLDPAAKVWTDAKYAICEHSLDPDEIYGKWGIKVEPDAMASDPSVSLPMGRSIDTGQPETVNLKKVYIGYFLPQAALPQGRYVVWVEEKTTTAPKEAPMQNYILYDSPWPYPSNTLPLVKFPGIRVPGSAYDDATVTAARPLQKELNRTLSQIVEYKNLTIKPRYFAPVGSLKTRITSESGAVYEFTPIAGMKPEMEKLPALPPYVFEHLRDITMRLREVFNLQEVTEGTVPPNVEAGIAIDLLQEMATDRLAPTIKLLEVALARAGKIMLGLAQQYYVEPRLLKIRGSGGSIQVKKFKGADIAGGVDVIAESGSGLPRTRAGRQARIESYIDRGILAPHQAWKYLDIADMRSVAARFAADEDQAYREHEKILKGQPLNMSAMMEVMNSVQMGMNPQTGEPIQSPEEAQQILREAALTPGPADNHSVHLDIHHDYIVSVEFENLPPEQQQDFLIHFGLTQQAANSADPGPEPQAPRVSYSIHGTTGVSGAAKIMQKAGIDVTPEEMTEPPMETLVMDSVDAVDKDDAGNDPLTQAEMMTGMAADAAKADADVRLTEAKIKTEEAKAKQTAKPKPASSGS